jgi:hypothetical protein
MRIARDSRRVPEKPARSSHFARWKHCVRKRVNEPGLRERRNCSACYGYYPIEHEWNMKSCI